MRLATCLTACLFAGAALAREPQASPQLLAWQAEAGERQWQHAERLASRGDARSLKQALFLGGSRDTEAATLRRAAWSDALRSLPITDAEHAWWHYYGCSQAGADCHDAQPLELLVQFDPDNLWTYLVHAQKAQREGRPDDALEWLQLAAQADDAVSSTNRMASFISEAMDGLMLPEPGAAVAAQLDGTADGSPGIAFSAETNRWVLAMGIYAALVMPEISTLNALCKPDQEALNNRAWRQACLGVAGRIGRKDTTLVGGGIGLAFAAQLASEDGDAIVWREEYRRFVYLNQVGTSATLDLKQDADVRVYLSDVFAHGERAALQRMLESRGQTSEPPADWLPDDARGRALILGEAEPAA